MKRSAVAALAAVLMLLAACTGVPDSSRPRAVDSIDIDNGSAVPQAGPVPNADARTIVQSFLAANAANGDDAVEHDTARKYLTSAAGRQWTDATATIISNPIVSTEQGGVVTVRGRLVGSLNQTGVYTPQLQGSGGGGGIETFRYRIASVRGQNRIGGLPPGLVLTTDQFTSSYRLHALYFFDQARRYLVPDPRWSALEGNRLNAFLVGLLASGPRPELASTVTNETVPPQANARRIAATGTVPVRIEIPGSSQLDARGKRLLAAQIAATVTDPGSDEQVVLTDGRAVVPMPGGQPAFTARSAAYAYTPVAPAADVFFLRGNKVLRAPGRSLAGKLRTSPYVLSSIAVTQAPGTDGYTVAGVDKTGTTDKLVIGTESSGYRDTTLRGTFSRPAWAPAAPPGSSAPPELWIGQGSRIVRVVVSGNRATAIGTVTNANAVGGRIVALRLSPEGSRVALVIQSATGTRRLYIGSVVRSAGQVRIDALPSISPDAVTVDDVGWIGPQKLIATGSVGRQGEPEIFETYVDGSFWTGRRAGDPLPGAPDSLSVAVSQLAWVSTGDTVWQQAGRGWTSPDGSEQTSGTKPVYLE